MFQESIRRNNPNFVIDHETETLLTCESPFSIAFKKFSGKKTLNEFIKKQTLLVAPKQITMGFDPVPQKEDSIQYAPIQSTLRVVLSHEDILAHILQQNENNDGVYKSFRDGAAYKNNLFLNSTPNVLELCIYHDDFSIVNPLGNKTHKHKISAFYFVLGNFPSKFRSRLNDIYLILLYPASLVAKYGYHSLLSPLIEDLKNLEINGISVNFDGLLHHFKDTLSMVVADNLADCALGGFFCNFFTVQIFCRFYNITKAQQNEKIPIFHFTLRTKNGYDNNIINENPNLSHLYGIKGNSVLNYLNYFHVADGLPPDLAMICLRGLQ